MADRIAAWIAEWSKADGSHGQIASLGGTLTAAMARLRARADAIPAGDEAFAICRGVDNDLAVVERMWTRFADGFAQRKDPVNGPVLRAAHELVCSCVAMAQPLAAAPLPLPLAYLEPAFSTSATPRIKPPPSAPAADRQIAAALRVMPIPLIGLPTTIVDEPWWLVLVAHEVGHHVQYDLEADEALIGRTATLLGQAGADPADAEAAARWAAWKYEAFADAFSVAALGPRALDVIAALEWDVGAAMGELRTPLYPPVVVRLALMAELASQLGFTDAPFRAAAWTEARADARIAAMLDRAPAVATALLDAPLGTGTLRTLVGRAEPTPTGAATAAAMAKVLAGRDIGLSTGLAEPRNAVSAAFGAWQALAAEPDPGARAKVAADLAPRTLKMVADVRDPATNKMAAGPDVAYDPIAARMFDAMRAAEHEGAP